jgi:hypothetical protein
MGRFAVALLHHPVLDKKGDIYTTSITNLDVHDIARSGRTYGVASFYVVTPITAQRDMANDILRFWEDGKGAARNKDRTEALSRAVVVQAFTEAIALETALLGEKPLIVSTSAKPEGTVPWKQARARCEAAPGVLLLFGTGHGLHHSVHDAADMIIAPICPNRDYNHLSVRSAAAIALDRLLGNPEE